jgi:hypothetical protein
MVAPGDYVLGKRGVYLLKGDENALELVVMSYTTL